MLFNEELLLQLIYMKAHLSQHRSYPMLRVRQIVNEDSFFLLVSLEVGFLDFGAVGTFVLPLPTGALFLRHLLILLQIIGDLGAFAIIVLIVARKLNVFLLQLIHSQLILSTRLVIRNDLHLLPILFGIMLLPPSTPRLPTAYHVLLCLLPEYLVNCLLSRLATTFLSLCFQLLHDLRLVEHDGVFSD